MTTSAMTTPTPPVDNLTTTQAHVLRYMRAHFAQELHGVVHGGRLQGVMA